MNIYKERLSLIERIAQLKADYYDKLVNAEVTYDYLIKSLIWEQVEGYFTKKSLDELERIVTIWENNNANIQ